MTTDPGTADDARLARDIATEAGRRLLALRAGDPPGGGGADGAADAVARLRDAGDRLSHEYITAELAHRRPGDAVLSEEGAAGSGQNARLTADRVWIVDPLDGTREFGEPGRTDWAVHVALWERGELTAGAVAVPARSVTLSTLGPVPSGGIRGIAGAQGNGGAAVTGLARKPLCIVVSRTRCPEIAERVAEVLSAGPGAGAELVPLGSAGAKVAAVLAGDADAYVHAGGFYEWDTAAPVAVARSAGFHASRLDGGPLRFNQEDVWMPDILVCSSALAGTLLEAISAAGSGAAGGVPGHGPVIG